MTLRTALLACVALACISGNPAFAKDRADKLAKVTQDPFVSGEAALVAGQFGNARQLLTQATAAAPTDGRRQLMLAMALHADALSSGKRDMVDMATVGYHNALKFRNGDFWANAMAGRLAYDEGKPAEALSFLSAAAIMQPDSADIFSSVAAAAYQTGDLPLARIASERALLLSKTQPSSSTLRTATLTAAAQGNQIDAETYLKQLSIFDPEAEAATRTRATQLLRTSGVEKDAANIPLQLPVEADDIGPNQITVDVAIILSQTESTNRTGINLLDGLRLQFGLNDDLTRSNQSGLGQIRDRVLTRAISIPELSYSLNLFNRANQSYRVVARPSLTAFRGETSEFFVGRKVFVEVSNVTLSQIQEIDIGIQTKVTPLEIDGNKVKMRIETSRAFLADNQIRTLNAALTTFRQQVAATAEVAFGETLILSGLSETAEDQSQSKTPVLGDVPGLNALFNQRSKSKREESVLILVTPSKATTIPSLPFIRAPAVEQLIQLWSKVVDPMSNLSAVVTQLQQTQTFSRMRPEDTAMVWPDPRAQAADVARSFDR